MSDFTRFNPWWKKSGWMGRSLEEYENAKVKWNPRIRYKFREDIDAVYTLRGPRQVGKTTLVKLNIRDLLKKGVSPRSIFYFDCEATVDTSKELIGVISNFLDLRASNKDQRTYVFIDEVSQVRNWQSAIKALSDRGDLRNCTVVLTGSHTLDMAKATERLPGRRGLSEDAPDKIMVPMKFAEYAETLDPELHDLFTTLAVRFEDVRWEVMRSLAEGKTTEELTELRYHERNLRKLFADYLLTGGLPKVIDDYRTKGEVSQSTYRRYVDVVRGDLSRWGKREGYIRRVLSRVLETLGSTVSWTSLGKGTDIGSHNTVEEYVDTLRDAFVLLYLYRLDTSRKGSAFEKEKKIYFGDPFFLHAMNAWVNGGDPFEESQRFLEKEQSRSLLVEGVIAEHMVRLAFQLSKQKQLFDYEKVLHYWKSSGQNEVDFVLDVNGSYLPIESKYKERISRDDRYGLADFSKVTGTKGEIIVSKNEFAYYKDGAIVPVWLFLLLI